MKERGQAPGKRRVNPPERRRIKFKAKNIEYRSQKKKEKLKIQSSTLEKRIQNSEVLVCLVCLVCLVRLVYLVYLVCLVCLVRLVKS